MGRKFLSGNSGATAIEYALLAMMIAVSCILAFATMGSNVSSTMQTASSQMDDGISATQDAPPIHY